MKQFRKTEAGRYVTEVEIVYTLSAPDVVTVLVNADDDTWHGDRDLMATIVQAALYNYGSEALAQPSSRDWIETAAKVMPLLTQERALDVAARMAEIATGPGDHIPDPVVPEPDDA